MVSRCIDVSFKAQGRRLKDCSFAKDRCLQPKPSGWKGTDITEASEKCCQCCWSIRKGTGSSIERIVIPLQDKSEFVAFFAFDQVSSSLFSPNKSRLLSTLCAVDWCRREGVCKLRIVQSKSLVVHAHSVNCAVETVVIGRGKGAWCGRERVRGQTAAKSFDQRKPTVFA